MKRINLPKKQAGYSLTEILIGVFVSVAVLVYVLTNWGTISAIWKGGKEASALASLTNTATGLATNGAFGTGDLTASVCDEVQAPLVCSGSGNSATISNSFGGAVTVTAQGALVQIQTAGEPNSACKKVASAVGQSQKASVSLQTDTGNIGSGLSMMPKAIGDACSGDNDNTITWTARAN